MIHKLGGKLDLFDRDFKLPVEVEGDGLSVSESLNTEKDDQFFAGYTVPTKYLTARRSYGMNSTERL